MTDPSPRIRNQTSPYFSPSHVLIFSGPCRPPGLCSCHYAQSSSQDHGIRSCASYVFEVPIVPSKLDDGITPISSPFFGSDPYDVARSFVTAVLHNQLSRGNSFVLHNDSYTDKATSVTHVFFRQMIDGEEVEESDINVNVKDGAVVSHDDLVSIVVRPLQLAGRLLYHLSFT